MNKIIVSLLIATILFAGFGYISFAKAQETIISQQEMKNQLIQLLLQLIAQLQQQVNDILAQQQATNSTVQKQEEGMQSIQDKNYCDDLKKKTPQTGHQEFINTDIVGYYKDAEQMLNNAMYGTIPSNSSKDSEIKFWKNNVNEATPLYCKFIQECGKLSLGLTSAEVSGILDARCK